MLFWEIVRGEMRINVGIIFRTKGRMLVLMGSNQWVFTHCYYRFIHRANGRKPIRGEAPSCKSIVRNEMEGYGVKAIFSTSQPHCGYRSVEIDFGFRNIVREEKPTNAHIFPRTKCR